ncbi:MAG: asparaginase [Flavobacteriaceae bacterium]|nr:asparaginase [Flavobacteriaceae bacterium]|tara:strand:+ start:32075 stop:32572 length:498 start_codon:yes stop_codon:yes gene_type:complete
MNNIQIFVTGGTFDKTYDYINGKLYFEETHIPNMLKRARCKLKVQIKQLMLLDSLEMRNAHLKKIGKACVKSNSNYIVITHGTDKMTDTAKYLINLNIKEKVIILTGAMVPYAFGSSSDGFFNLGCALSLVQTLNYGVYITMHGQIFEGDKVIKDLKNGVFNSKN